jgi:anthranilate/para-aminobenzoate synthase component I
MSVVRRGPVQHLASTLTGTLRAGLTGWDALARLFPGSAATGVPRRLALDAIRRIEAGPRGLYGGAVFRCDSNGDLDVALVLRAVIVHNGQPRLQAGAGITAASVPDREFAETQRKLASIARYLVPAGTPERVAS